jgi:hypothetical protein
VEKVESGFKGFREIDTVHYDRNVISPDEMINTLKKAGTYRGMAEEK